MWESKDTFCESHFQSLKDMNTQTRNKYIFCSFPLIKSILFHKKTMK